jgi:hydrophobe/amphiphile efflux-3 (HAE3) family protein
MIGISKLKVESNMEDMLPKDSESLKASQDFNQYFEGQDQVFIVVTADEGAIEENPELFHQQAMAYMDALAERLEGETYVNSIMYKVSYEDMQAFEWAYLDEVVYDAIETAMASEDFESIQSTLKKLEADRSEVPEAVYLSSESMKHYMMVIRPVLNQDDYVGSREAFYNGVNRHINELLDEEAYERLEAGLTGGGFIQDLEADQVAFGSLGGTMMITILLVLAIVILFFGSLKLPALAMYPLILGAMMATASAYLIYGSLNMFSVSFALLLLGLGIDFAVHLIARYQEERQSGASLEAAIHTSIKSTGSSIVMGAATTAFAFGAFAFAKFKAFEQMGIISAIGLMSLCIVMLILMPVLIGLSDKNYKEKRTSKVGFKWLKVITEFQLKRPWIVMSIILITIVALYPGVVHTKVESDMNAIYPKDLPSLKWAEVVQEAYNYDIDTLSVYVDDISQLESLVDLGSREDISRIESIQDYLPENMERKVDIVTKLDIMLQGKGLNLFNAYDIRTMEIDDFPESVKANYIGSEGKIRVEIIPAFNIYDRESYDILVNAIVKETGRLPVGMPTIMNEVTLLVKKDMTLISILCFALVFVISWVAFRRLRLALLTTMPLGITIYTTLGLLPLLGVEINVFSIAAFPLIIGIGIDSGIHLIHRLNEVSGLTIPEKVMATGKAIILTGLTTIIGFGSLANIHHPGMANLGLTVAIGMTISMIFTLVFIPLGYQHIER